jgi:bifunctional non-homologous end joining protein LigD
MRIMPGTHTDIQTYNRKRDFRKTAEPPGKVSSPTRGLPKFVIQKHDASRLHYDFRLEIDGVLCSWAVPKGPSMDPGEKRLAVRTEDHPMAYGSFEGTIPKGEYGGGTVMLWDEGRFKPEGDAKAALKKGDLKFEIMGHRLRGKFGLVRMRKRGNEKTENWLLIKKRDSEAREGSGDAVVVENVTSVTTQRAMDEIAAGKSRVWHSNRDNGHEKPAASVSAEEKPAAAKMPKIKHIDVAKLTGARKDKFRGKLAPQLATLIEEAPEGDAWLSEIKFDGYRMLARIDDGQVKIFSRNGLPWERKLPQIADSLSKLNVRQAWLDGEIVVLDDEGRSSFGKLKDALGEGPQSSIFFFLFDILYLDGYSTVNCKQVDRKALLHSILGAAPPPFLKYSDHVEGVPDTIRQKACEMRLEGIIVKAADAPYQHSRNRNWLKLKCIQREELVIVGYTEPKGSRTGFGALQLGYYDKNGHLHFAGGVGAGFTVKTLEMLHKKLVTSARKIPPSIWLHGEKPPKGMHWVKPELVAEFQFTEWTKDGSIRHGVFLGLRDDKTANEVVRDPPTTAISRFTGAGAVVKATSKATAKKRAAKSKVALEDVPAIIDKRDTKSGDVNLTHPDKLLWPDDDLTKADLAAYWERASAYALPFIAGRPLAIVRCPEGIDEEQFFQKRTSPGFPKQILDIDTGQERIMAIEGPEGLRALSQMSAVEIHPWGATVANIEKPDVVVIDLDPDPGVSFTQVIQAVKDINAVIESAGLTTFCKTTGGKGLHIVIPVQPTLGWDEVKEFAKSIASGFARAEPKRFTDKMSKATRKGRIFIDYLRNGRGATAIAPFSPRARAGGTIAMPVKWSQVKVGLEPKRFTIAATERELKAGAEAWKDFFKVKQALTDKVRRAFARL